MRVALLLNSVFAGLVLAGCTQTSSTGSPQADALVAELQAESMAIGTATTAIRVAASMDPSGMAAGPTHALTRGMIRAHSAQVNARIQNRVMAQEMAILKCFEESKAMSGRAAEDYNVACAKRVRGTP